MLSKLCTKCRRTRIVLTAVLILMSGITGYHWCMIHDDGGIMNRMDYLVISVTLVLLVLVAGFAIDAVSSTMEEETVVEGERNRLLAEQAQTTDKNVREMSLLIEDLKAENSRLRELVLAGKTG